MEKLFLGFSKITQGGIWLILQWKRLWNKDASWADMHWVLQYLPSMVYYTGLGIKHRDMNIYGAANPKMKGLGGFIGVPKSEIFEGKSAEKFLPKSLFLAAPHDFEVINTEREKIGIVFPCIIKPDIGERGMGVRKVKNKNELKSYLETHMVQDLLLQKQITAKREWGVLCVRNPKTGKIEVPDAAEKVLPTAIGDGVKTMDELVSEAKLNDRQKRLIREDHTQTELQTILKKGEEKVLISVASINLGARVKILSKRDQRKLEKVCNDILVDEKDIHAGRLDLKAESLEDLIAGKCWVIELNGVGGMPSSVYSDDLSISEKYKIMLAHFKRVSMIGIENKKKYNIKSVGFWKSMGLIRKGLRERKKL